MAVYKQLFGKCWFCQRREADESTVLLVEVKKETRIEGRHRTIFAKTEAREVVIPRCPQCAAIQKRKNRILPILTIAALLSAVIGGFGAAKISSNQNSDWLPFLGCTAGLVIFLALYFFWEANRVKRLSPEQRQDNSDAQKSFLDYPEIALERNKKREEGVTVFFKTIS